MDEATWMLFACILLEYQRDSDELEFHPSYSCVCMQSNVVSGTNLKCYISCNYSAIDYVAMVNSMSLQYRSEFCHFNSCSFILAYSYWNHIFAGGICCHKFSAP